MQNNFTMGSICRRIIRIQKYHPWFYDSLFSSSFYKILFHRMNLSTGSQTIIIWKLHNAKFKMRLPNTVYSWIMTKENRLWIMGFVQKWKWINKGNWFLHALNWCKYFFFRLLAGEFTEQSPKFVKKCM